MDGFLSFISFIQAMVDLREPVKGMFEIIEGAHLPVINAPNERKRAKPTERITAVEHRQPVPLTTAGSPKRSDQGG
jgi:hypothetical protein